MIPACALYNSQHFIIFRDFAVESRIKMILRMFFKQILDGVEFKHLVHVLHKYGNLRV